MSWLPIINAWVIFSGLVSLFLWKLGGVLLFVVASGIALYGLFDESLTNTKHYMSGFWMFLLSEVMAFGSLFTVCILTEEEGVSPLSSFVELPLLGCFFLTGSSITVTAYHHYLGSGSSRVFLLGTIILGACFIGVQLAEFYSASCDLLFCIYQAVCFCTVGLHFIHVLGGLVALSVLLISGAEFRMSRVNVDCLVWYWHFVDYIWLFVYIIIYVC
uniref:Cytochrome c oxidase subunit 3 n=1 Tax=Echinochasmus japonicus TaxID=1197313 RepID=A0A186QDK7_9TREM|nr:cytochrome c oxidase subunit III [Echinochasmus japonicus]AKL39056.1 cytochrome c oxidase subunit III [Echinochasmus japonicus]